MKKKLLLLILIISIPVVSEGSLLESNELELSIRQEGAVLTSGASELTLGFLIYPKEGYSSEIKSIETTPQAKLENRSYFFEWSSPLRKVNYSLESRVRNRVRISKVQSRSSFPFEVPDKYKEYTESTQLCDSDSPKVQKLANSIASGEKDTYKVVFELSKWVHSNLEYDLKYKGETKKASEVIDLRRGTCDEYSNLLIALARSLNIPSRYITGYSYGTFGEREFDSHGWVEVWIPNEGWVPIDPTYGEVGWLDATHVELLISEGPQPSSVKYNWKNGEFINGSMTESIRVVSRESKIPTHLRGNLSLEEESVSPGSYNILWLTLKNPNPYYVSTVASVSAAPSLVGVNQKMVFLPPEKEKEIGWIIKYPSNLSSDYIYTYRNNASAYFLGEKGASNVVKYGAERLTRGECEALLSRKEDKGEQGSPNLTFNIKKPEEVRIGEKYQIELYVKNEGSAPFENLTACVNEKCKSSYIGIGETISQKFKSVSFSKGRHTVTVTFRNLNITSQEVEVWVEERTVLEKILDFLEV